MVNLVSQVSDLQKLLVELMMPGNPPLPSMVMHMPDLAMVLPDRQGTGAAGQALLQPLDGTSRAGQLEPRASGAVKAEQMCFRAFGTDRAGQTLPGVPSRPVNSGAFMTVRVGQSC